jgi:hypothetical protein
VEKFPDVDNYSGRWPVTDLMKMHLKNTSTKHRCAVQKVAAGKFGNKAAGKVCGDYADGKFTAELATERN